MLLNYRYRLDCIYEMVLVCHQATGDFSRPSLDTGFEQ
jgi:hypothetical protein